MTNQFRGQEFKKSEEIEEYHSQITGPLKLGSGNSGSHHLAPTQVMPVVSPDEMYLAASYATTMVTKTPWRIAVEYDRTWYEVKKFVKVSDKAWIVVFTDYNGYEHKVPVGKRTHFDLYME